MNIDETIKNMTNIKPKNEEQRQRIELVREAYHNVAKSLHRYTKNSREQSIAVTELETSLMWAIKSIVKEM